MGEVTPPSISKGFVMNILTVTDICNAALDMVSGQNIQDIDDETNPNAELCKRHYAQIVKKELATAEWTFARRFVKLHEIDYTRNPDAKIEGYYGYVLPADFARLSLYFFSQFYPYRSNQYDRCQNYFLTSKYIYTRRELSELAYISDNPNLSEYDACFIDMIEASLAAKIAPKIMGSDANTDFLYKLYLQSKHVAMRNGAMQMEASPTGLSDTQIARF